MQEPFVSRIDPPDDLTTPALWFIFRGSELLVIEKGEEAAIPMAAGEQPFDLQLLRCHYLGYQPGDPAPHCFTAEVAADCPPPAGMGFYGLRQLYGRIPDPHLWIGGRAVQIIDWDRNHQFCSRCGAPSRRQDHERAKKCPHCGLVTYPRLSPAIIVRVQRFDGPQPQLLMARAHRFPPGWYSVIAGFVEPGETLEECVQREVWEEVRLRLKNIRYFGSQPWPFPNSLMVAYTAEYAGGDIVLEEEELVDARWFTGDALPKIPPPMSIARALIDDFVQRHAAAGPADLS